MRSNSFVRPPILGVLAIALWCGGFIFTGSAAAQSITCTGDEALGPDGFGDTLHVVLRHRPPGTQHRQGHG